MIRKLSHKLLPVLAVALFAHSAKAKPGFVMTPDDCQRSYENGYMYHCEYVKCVCESNVVGGEFYHTDGGTACQNSAFYSCSVAGKGEFICTLEGLCKWYPDEVLNPDRDPNWPTIGDAGQVVAPVEDGSGIPGAIGGGPGATELVETNTGDFDPGEVFQAGEVNSWFVPGAYGHGAEFQLDAFLADAPLDYLEALLELQTLDLIRPDAPVAYYYVMKGGRDCNDNWVPDAADIEEGTSLDLNQNAIPDECEQNEFDGVDVASPSKGTDEHDANASDSSGERKTNTSQASPSPCGSGVGAPVVMLSLCWMFVATGRTARQRTHTRHQRSNSISN